MFAPLALLALCLTSSVQGNPAKDLKSKDYAVRLAAIESVAAAPDAKSGKLLAGMLKDQDWEVVEAALVALGKVGGKGLDKKLLKVALDAPLKRHRQAASQALARAFAESGWVALKKKLSGKTAFRAAESAVAFFPLAGKVELRALEKMLRSKEAGEVRVASIALVALDGDRLSRLKGLWFNADLRTRCEILQAMLHFAEPEFVPFLLDVLSHRELTDVVERRTRQVIADLGKESVEAVLAAVQGGCAQSGQASRIRLLQDLLRKQSIPADRALKCMLTAAEASDAAARSAIAHALLTVAQIGKEADKKRATEWLLERAVKEEKRIPRGTAVRSLAELVDVAPEKVVKTLTEVLQKDRSPRIREDAAVSLAIKGQPLAADALMAALNDENIWVKVTAAVSLGMTRDQRGVDTLATLTTNSDWRLRGAAVIGLQRSYLKAAIPPIIHALQDEDATVRRTAHETLMRISQQGLPTEVEPWQEWWTQVERAIQLFDPQEIEARRKKYGYGGPADHDTGSLFDGFDVVVVQSRGDHMEHVLDKLDIQHRKTAYGKLVESALHPHAVCVVNCTGEIDPNDVDRLAWFVRTGGYLLGSCWTLSETIGRIYPGVIRKLPTQGEVMDDVLASPCASESPYLSGVFPPGCEPRYALVGAHLIQVLDYERCEVLVDSPECAAAWGEGNLAAWFPAGHGIILDSVNHFEEQGLMRATYLKKKEERQAYAIDHMGLRYFELRKILKEKFWNKNSQAAREVLDLSVFRILSNFVREKRIAAE